VHFGGATIYHLGDTALFGDMELIGRRHAIDVALVPIGGFFTMDPDDAAEAVRLIGPRQVIPCHYNTWPPIEVDVGAFKAEVESSTATEVVVLEPGETHKV
jgi:L-ascorbate metabolism protein UlaG (beta-lactamase superfamily)